MLHTLSNLFKKRQKKNDFSQKCSSRFWQHANPHPQDVRLNSIGLIHLERDVFLQSSKKIHDFFVQVCAKLIRLFHNRNTPIIVFCHCIITIQIQINVLLRSHMRFCGEKKIEFYN
jgi:hypothetical protein